MLPWLMGFSREDKQSGRFGGDTAVANMQVVATAESGGQYSHWPFSTRSPCGFRSAIWRRPGLENQVRLHEAGCLAVVETIWLPNSRAR